MVGCTPFDTHWPTGMPLHSSTTFLVDLPEESPPSINDLPDELLSYMIQLGVELQRDRWKRASASEDEDQRETDDPSTTSEICDPDDDDDMLPFQVLVSHVCRRWRSLALDTSRFWTALSFHKQPKLDKAKEYIARSNDQPLTVLLNCIPEHTDWWTQERIIALEKLHQILEILETAVSQWGTFTFHGNNNHVQLLMSRLNKMPAAPLLESFRIYDYDVFLAGEDKVAYLPFHGQAPRLKEVDLCGIHLDWVGAAPKFLHGLRELQLSHVGWDARPSYSTFTQIINNSPDLRILALSFAGPALAYGVDFDSDEGWGREPLTISSLEELTLQFHDPKYASALVQHLKLPNVTRLELYFDDEDYSGFVEILAGSAGRQHSLLQQITYLIISGLPCDERSVELFLSQLGELKNFHLDLCNEKAFYEKLVDHPTVFCPKLEEFISEGLLDRDDLKRLLRARSNAGLPLKTLTIVTNDRKTWEVLFPDPSDALVGK